MAEQNVGDILDQLDVTADLLEGDVVVSAVVVMSVYGADDTFPRLELANSDSMSWIEQVGLLRAAERIASDPATLDEEA